METEYTAVLSEEKDLSHPDAVVVEIDPETKQITGEARAKLIAIMGRTLDERALSDELRAKVMSEFEKTLGQIYASGVQLRAKLACDILRSVASRISAHHTIFLGVAKELASQGGSSKAVYEVGVAAGHLFVANATLTEAVEMLEHAANCTCNEKDADESGADERTESEAS